MRTLLQTTNSKGQRAIGNWQFYALLFAFCLLPFASSLQAGGGDDHTHAGEKPRVVSNEKKYFSVETFSEKHELLLRYSPIHPREEATLQLFISNFLTNQPLDSVTFQLSSPQDVNLKFIITRTDKGNYEIKVNFPQAKSYNITVALNSPLGPDLILLQNIEVGKELTNEENTDQHAWYSNSTIVFVGGLIAGLIVMFLLMRFSNKPVKAVIMIFVLLIPTTSSQFAFAHEGHDGADKKGNNFSNAFEVPKETQFLFEVVTHPVQEGSFTETTKLYGTVIPSSNGQALVQSPQTGKIASLQITVGQKVSKGQLLASVEPSLDAGNAVSFLAERNNVEAELEAAKKEYDRFKSIEDIAAKRDVSEAEARYKKAVENKKLYERLANGQSDNDRSIFLRSPIEGVVSNFTLTIGSSVNAGETLFTITNLDKVYVEAQVFDKDAAKVNQGKSFEVDCTTNDIHKTEEVKLIAAAQTINPTNQTQRVLFEMQNHNEEFKIGEFVNVRVLSSQPVREISMPNSAISEINGKPVVFIKDSAESYSVSYVSLGHNNGTNTVINKGIEEGERVVTNGTYQMKMIYLNQ
jgi:membrane fusion protein, heavy metal efflux system